MHSHYADDTRQRRCRRHDTIIDAAISCQMILRHLRFRFAASAIASRHAIFGHAATCAMPQLSPPPPSLLPAPAPLLI